MDFRKLFVLWSLSVRFGAISQAGPEEFRTTREVNPPEADTRFDRGHFELSLLKGAFFSPSDLGNLFPRTRTKYDYTLTQLRAGYMLHSPWEAGLLRGNFEFLVGLDGGAENFGRQSCRRFALRSAGISTDQNRESW